MSAGGPDDGAGDEQLGGAFDNLNAIIAAVNACSNLLELNISSMMAAGTKLDEMQAHLGAVGRLRQEIIDIVRMRLADAEKIDRAMNRINGDGEPDGNLESVASMMQLVEQSGNTLVAVLEQFGQGMELIRKLLSSIDRRTGEMVNNQIAGKAILDRWTIR